MLHVRQGFTLIELLIALFVFSLLSAFSYHAINQLVNSRHMLSGELEALFSMQKTFLFLERDVQQSLNMLKMANVESLSTKNSLTGLSLQNAMGRTDYLLRDDVLYLEYRALPITENIEHSTDSLALLSGVQSLLVSSMLKGIPNNDHQYIGVEISIQNSIFKKASRVNFVGLKDLGDVDFSTLNLPSGVGDDNSTGMSDDNSTVTDIPANY